MSTGQLMTSSEVAALIGRSVRTVHRMASNGVIPYEQQLHGPTGAYLFRRDVVEEVISGFRVVLVPAVEVAS